MPLQLDIPVPPLADSFHDDDIAQVLQLLEQMDAEDLDMMFRLARQPAALPVFEQAPWLLPMHIQVNV